MGKRRNNKVDPALRVDSTPGDVEAWLSSFLTKDDCGEVRVIALIQSQGISEGEDQSMEVLTPPPN